MDRNYLKSKSYFLTHSIRPEIINIREYNDPLLVAMFILEDCDFLNRSYNGNTDLESIYEDLLDTWRIMSLSTLPNLPPYSFGEIVSRYEREIMPSYKALEYRRND